MNSKELCMKISEHIFAKKGFNVLMLDLNNLSGIADYFLICSADSDTQVKAIADEIDDKLSAEGIKCYHKEGLKGLNWVLMDYIDVVVHVFKSSSREYYKLEKLWGDAAATAIEDPLLKKIKPNN